MRKFLLKIGHFRRSEDGATLVEYGIALLVAVVVGATALITLANTTERSFLGANNVMDGGLDAAGVGDDGTIAADGG